MRRSEPLVVLGRATSSNVQPVMWCAAELGLSVDRRDYGHVHGGLDTPEYAAMNPNRLVPVLKDGDLVLWESAAIVRYLAARYGDDAFWPGDAAERAPLDMWAEWIKTTFAPALTQGLFYPLIRTAAADRAPDAAEKGAAGIAPLALMLDARIAEGPWLAGGRFTWADIMVGTLLYRYFTMPFERPDTPSLAAYYARLTGRPAYAGHVMVSYDPLRAEGD